MKNIKNLLRVSFLALGLLFSAKQINAQTISNHIFGQNAWMPDTIGHTVLNGKLDQQWGNIKASNATIIRFGGAAADKDMPTNFQYIKMIDAIRANGMEPMIQVPFNKNQYTAQQAAVIVNYINVVMGRNIKYWIIGNEPDLAYAYNNASQIAAYIKPFASAMKAADPSILIIGPECASFNKNIVDGLTSGPDDITGKDQSGKYYIDIFSFHTYPFDGTQTRPQVISKLTSPGSFQDNLIYLNSRVAAANTAHGRTGTAAIKTALTEANISWQNSPTDGLNGAGANSFIGGQFIAEMMGIGMKNGLDIMNIWSVIEGNGTIALNIGYIDPNTNNKKPSYYHFKLLAENFKGSYVDGTSNVTNVKSFGSQNAQNTTVLVMNEDMTNNYNFTIRLNADAVTGNNPLKINIKAGIAVEYNDLIPNQSTMLLIFNPQGVLIKKIEYSLLVHAVSNLAPTAKEFGVPTAVVPINGESTNLKGFQINLFPNPANSKFTIELDRRNPEEKKFEIEIFDLLGRLIYNKKTVFLDRLQEIDLSGNSMAEAVYVVKVHEQEDKDNTRAKKIILFK